MALGVVSRDLGPGVLVMAPSLRRGLISGGVIVALGFIAHVFKLRWSWQTSVVLLGTVGVLEVWPRHPYQVVFGMGAVLAAINLPWMLVAYHLGFVTLAYALRARGRLLALCLGVAVFVIPKQLFRAQAGAPAAHTWLDANVLAQFFYVCCLWWQERKRGVITDTGLAKWGALFLFPAHAVLPMSIAPSVLWRARTGDSSKALETSLLAISKAVCVLVAQTWFSHGLLSSHSPAGLMALPVLHLWTVVVFSLLVYFAALSGMQDLVVAVARALGWQLPHAFRFPLLAWNPVELWRRWGIYNRKLLLSLVYFPLGGGRHRFRNVLLTFAASGLVMHTGFVGSKHWRVGIGGWRDQTVYFLLQGVAVCACLAFWRWRGKDVSADRDLRLCWSRGVCTASTLVFNAWLHVLVLAPHVSFADRWRLMARCLGL